MSTNDFVSSALLSGDKDLIYSFCRGLVAGKQNGPVGGSAP